MQDGNLDFIGRIDQQVKIRGYRIELGEIESKLLRIKSIKEAIVIDRKDQAGESYLCAYIVCKGEPEISGLRNILVKDLPGYMIPTYFMQLEHIPLTPSGKVDRKALPAPGAVSGPGYIAPGNKVEEKLVKIWSEVLNISEDVIGIDSDFFHLGGHSLKAMRLAVRINKELDVKMPLLEIFKSPFIRSLSQYVKDAKPGKYEFLEAVEKKEYYPLTAAQQGIYVQHQKERGRSAYSIPHTMLLDINIDTKRLELTFKKLIQRHESLRTSFQMLEGNPVQRVHDEVEFEIEYYDIGKEGTMGLAPLPSGPAPGNWQPAANIIKNFIRPFDLAQPPLIRAGIIETDQAYILLLDMHHIIADGISTEVAAKEFMSLYNGEQCPPLRLSCKDYSIWQNRSGIIDKRKKQGEFWLKEYEGDIPVLDMPLDYQRPEQRSFEGGWVRFAIDGEITGKLKEMSRQTGATLYIILLAAFYILLSKYTRQEDIIVGSPVNGRNQPDLENIIGLFINMLALRNRPGRNKTFKHFLKEVKEKVLGAFENQDYQFKELLVDLGLQGDVRRNPLFDVVFSMAVPNFEKTGEDGDKPGDYNELKTFVHELKHKITPFDMILGSLESNGIIEITIAYATAL
ncbi:condensation domain-containing protein, partial [Acidobacteriota bacterium]